MKEIRPTITQSPDDLARFFKTLRCPLQVLGWPGFEPMSPAQQMGALPISLTRQQKNIAHNHIIYMYLELILNWHVKHMNLTHLSL